MDSYRGQGQGNQTVNPNRQEDLNEGMRSLQEGKLSAQERRVIAECGREAFWSRSLPASVFAMTATTWAVFKGYLKPNPRFGSVPKSIGMGFLAYFIGKFSYAPICREKVLREIPDSNLAIRIRQGIGIPAPQMDSETSSSVVPMFESDQSESDPRAENDSQNSEEKRVTYDEMRKRHREEAARSYYRQPFPQPQYRPPAQQFQQPHLQDQSNYDNTTQSPETDPNYAPPSKLRKPRNKYGDEGFE